jgi:hypothetical protein
MNISLSKHSNSSSKIYTTSRILYISTHLESLVLAGLAHVIVNVSIHLFPKIKYLDPLAPRSNTNGKGWAMPIHITHKMLNKFCTGLD